MLNSLSKIGKNILFFDNQFRKNTFNCSYNIKWHVLFGLNYNATVYKTYYLVSNILKELIY